MGKKAIGLAIAALAGVNINLDIVGLLRLFYDMLYRAIDDLWNGSPVGMISLIVFLLIGISLWKLYGGDDDWQPPKKPQLVIVKRPPYC